MTENINEIIEQINKIKDDNTEYIEPTVREKIDELIKKDFKQNMELRKEFSRKIFWFLMIWSVLLFIILFFQGSKYELIEWSDSVIIALITTTFGNIVALMILVLKYLFPNK